MISPFRRQSIMSSRILCISWHARALLYTMWLPKTLPRLGNTVVPNGLDLMVMTLGGNNIGFGNITNYCLFYPKVAHWRDCESARARAWSIIRGQDLEDTMFEVYDGIFDILPNEPSRQLYHIFYPTFFDTRPGLNWCRIFSFFPLGPLGGALLTKTLRTELNGITYALNDRLLQIATRYRDIRMPERGSRQGLFTINPNYFWSLYDGFYVDLFEGHRFCNSRGPYWLGNRQEWDCPDRESLKNEVDAQTYLAEPKHRSKLSSMFYVV